MKVVVIIIVTQERGDGKDIEKEDIEKGGGKDLAKDIEKGLGRDIGEDREREGLEREKEGLERGREGLGRDIGEDIERVGLERGMGMGGGRIGRVGLGLGGIRGLGFRRGIRFFFFFFFSSSSFLLFY